MMQNHSADKQQSHLIRDLGSEPLHRMTVYLSLSDNLTSRLTLNLRALSSARYIVPRAHEIFRDSQKCFNFTFLI